MGLAFSVFNLFSYGFGVCGIWYLFLFFFCHWVIKTLFRSVCAGLTSSLCVYFVLFLKSGSLGCIFFSPLSQHITVQVHLLFTSLHFFSHFRVSLGSELRSQIYGRVVYILDEASYGSHVARDHYLK